MCSWTGCGRRRAAPVAYAELPLAQHAFDVLASLRCQATTSAVADFLEGARAATAKAEGPGGVPGPEVSDAGSPQGGRGAA